MRIIQKYGWITIDMKWETDAPSHVIQTFLSFLRDNFSVRDFPETSKPLAYIFITPTTTRVYGTVECILYEDWKCCDGSRSLTDLLKEMEKQLGVEEIPSPVLIPNNSELKYGKITYYPKGYIKYEVRHCHRISSFETFIHEIPHNATHVVCRNNGIVGWNGIEKLPASVFNLDISGCSFQNLEGGLSQTNVTSLVIEKCGLQSFKGLGNTKINHIEAHGNPCSYELEHILVSETGNIYVAMQKLRKMYP